MSAMECVIRGDENLAPCAAQVGIEEVEKSGVTEQRPAQRQIDEADGRLPCAGLDAMAQAQRHRGIHIGNNRPGYWM